MANYLWKVMWKDIKNLSHLWNARLFCILISQEYYNADTLHLFYLRLFMIIDFF